MNQDPPRVGRRKDRGHGMTIIGIVVMTALVVASPGWCDAWYEHYQRGEDALLQQDWAAAGEELTAAIQNRAEPGAPARLYGMKSRDYFPYYKLGIAFFNLGEYEAAIQAFDSELRFGAIDSSPSEKSNLETLKDRAETALSRVQDPEDTLERETQRLLKEAEILLEQGRLEESATALDRLLALDPSLDESRALLQEVRARMREQAAQRRSRERAADLVAEARGLLLSGDYGEALVRLDEAQFLDPQPATGELADQARSALGNQAREEAGNRRIEEALRLEEQGSLREALLALGPLPEELAGGQGLATRDRILAQLAEEEEGRARLEDVNRWIQSGVGLFEEGLYEASLIDFNRVLASDPGNSRALDYLKRVYSALNRAVMDSLRVGSRLPPVLTLALRETSNGEQADQLSPERVQERDYLLTALILDDQPEVEVTLVRLSEAGETLWSSPPERLQGQRLGKHWSFGFSRSVSLEEGPSNLVVRVRDSDQFVAEASHWVRYERSWLRPAWIGGLLALVVMLGLVRAVARKSVRKRSFQKRRFNPYIAGPPVQDANLFFGREDLIRRILQTIHNNSILIYGERRIGKTSLLHVLERRLIQLQDEEFVFVPVYIDLQGTPEERFFESMAEQLFEELSGPLSDARPHSGRGLPSDYSFHSFVRDLRDVLRLLQRRSEKRVKLVLLVDEVDELNHYDSRTNQKLRSLFMKSFAENLVAVFAGVAIRHAWDRDGSPWYNFFEEVEVGALKRSHAIALVEQPLSGVLGLQDGVAEKLVDLVSCKPYRIQRLCIALVQRAHDQGSKTIRMEDLDALTGDDDSVSGVSLQATED